jgi:predicted ester cyclase
MADEAVRDLVNAIYRAINARDLDALDGLFTPDYVDHQDNHQGVDPFKEQLRVFYVALPDLHIAIDDVVVFGDHFASRTTITGNSGELMGMPPTGTKMSMTAVEIDRIEGGRAAERWGGLDRYSLLVQLGVIPASQPA